MRLGDKMAEKKSNIIAVVGPTASGKTDLAIRLAKHFGGEIISADSMQIYTGMSIATAKPEKNEMQGIPHHLMDFLDPKEKFSVSQYCEMADIAARDILSRGKVPVLCGGTGLYVRSFLENIQFAEEKVDEVRRAELNRIYETEGGEKLLDYLRTFDPETAGKLLPANSKRIIRAIEIYETTGKTMSQQIAESHAVPSPYKAAVIGITYADRQVLYDRINRRVEIMLEKGLVQETREFYASDIGNTAAAAIGYKELKPWLDGEITFAEAVEKLKQETRHYAKRQLTWFKKDEYIHWIYADRTDDIFRESVEIIEREFDKN